jgi:hypothetical protein
MREKTAGNQVTYSKYWWRGDAISAGLLQPANWLSEPQTNWRATLFDLEISDHLTVYTHERKPNSAVNFNVLKRIFFILLNLVALL